MKKLTVLFFVFLLSTMGFGQDTFSIIAVDPVTGEIGSAGATCISSTGGSNIADIITDIIPGQGGVNSQAYVCIPNINLQNAILQMEAGLSPSEIIDYLMANDACNSQNFDPNYRQYGIVDLDENGDPRAAGWTGSMTDDYKEDRQGATFSIQGNILLNPSVIDQMEANFNTTSGTLADKLMAALQGANFPGADSRCLANGTSSRTAYLLVYKADDDPNDPYIKIVVPVQAVGTEPIDILQDLYDAFLSISEPTVKSKLQLFPNPTNNNLTLALDPSVTLTAYEVYDITGKRLIKHTSHEMNYRRYQVSAANLQSGVYFLKVTTEQGEATFKFVKQ
ncbi:MAG: DUF1028 domain-containing protein [Altibacter sp.]|uniref:DUF1028 domain-containing protein n=1 Tax=Altibacter sp. TaxID=2024823 RepID=UPI001D2F47F1|nr:DUF1028 domain-containing protein [Altibacter sp.]MBZ0327292.1 DUF1028 domain-containing protein [Altibacter sp.]